VRNHENVTQLNKISTKRWDLRTQAVAAPRSRTDRSFAH